MATKTDVLVIGGGPGGYVAAIKLGQLGRRPLVIDRDKLGGECLNYGCIPSKALINAAGSLYKPHKAESIGLEHSDALSIDWKRTIAWKNQLVGAFVKNVGTLVKANKGDVMTGAARFTGKNSAEITSEGGRKETVEFEKAVIATGSESIAIPGFAIDGKDVLGSKEALDLTEAPKALLVIGAGVIGLEIGTFFAKLGTKVTVVEFLDRILPVVEQDLTVPVSRVLQRLGVELIMSSKAKSYAKKGGRLEAVIETPEGEKKVVCDKILLAVGRSPRTKGLGLEAAGVETDKRGHVLVDTEMLTSNPNIYAIGDCIGQPYLAHKASREGIIAAQSIAGKPLEARGAVPWAIFTDPEIAWVGETETEAKARGARVAVGKFPFSASGRAQAVRETEGFCKIVADAQTHKILGAGFAGPAAADLIGEACLAVSLEATLEQVARTIHPHPTLNESFIEAAEAALGHPIHTLPAPAGRAPEPAGRR